MAWAQASPNHLRTNFIQPPDNESGNKHRRSDVVERWTTYAITPTSQLSSTWVEWLPPSIPPIGFFQCCVPAHAPQSVLRLIPHASLRRPRARVTRLLSSQEIAPLSTFQTCTKRVLPWACADDVPSTSPRNQLVEQGLFCSSPGSPTTTRSPTCTRSGRDDAMTNTCVLVVS